VPAEYTAEVRRLATEMGELAALVGGKSAGDGAEIGAAAHDFLNHAAYTLLAWCWWRTLAALPAAADPVWAEGKRAAARFYFERLVPRAAAHAAAVRAGAGGLMESSAEALLA
jgi:hypothetical protein